MSVYDIVPKLQRSGIFWITLYIVSCHLHQSKEAYFTIVIRNRIQQ